jgi:UDP-N-acetylglucosamine transferase subunit ALG13
MEFGSKIISKINIFRGNLLMILVLLGTFHIEFKRPLVELDILCDAGKISEHIIVQNGHTQFASKNFDMRPFMSPDELDELYDKARIIITHAGTGSIIKGVKKGKKVIAIARLKKNDEHIDDHQLEILDKFVSLGYIQAWHEHAPLEQILAHIGGFEPKPYFSEKKKIEKFLKEYIDSL